MDWRQICGSSSSSSLLSGCDRSAGGDDLAVYEHRGATGTLLGFLKVRSVGSGLTSVVAGIERSL